jgi:hypothetical protein
MSDESYSPSVTELAERPYLAGVERDKDGLPSKRVTNDLSTQQSRQAFGMFLLDVSRQVRQLTAMRESASRMVDGKGMSEAASRHASHLVGRVDDALEVLQDIETQLTNLYRNPDSIDQYTRDS